MKQSEAANARATSLADMKRNPVVREEWTVEKRGQLRCLGLREVVSKQKTVDTKTEPSAPKG